MLALGTKFIPTPFPGNTLLADLEKFYRLLRIKYLYHSQSNPDFKKKFHIPSLWQPPPASKNIESYLNSTQELFNTSLSKSLPQLQHYRPWNISLQQRLFLLKIKKNQEIIIKPADKNLGLTIMNKSWYDGEILRQLADVKTYKEVQFDKIPTKKIYEDIVKIFTSPKVDFSSDIVKFIKQKITPTTLGKTYNIPPIYILPKVHKPTLAGRPIVPSHSWITYPASVWLDDLLQPLVKNIPTVISDSKSLVNELMNLKIHDQHCTLITADVSSLYTEIPTKTGIAFVRRFLAEQTNFIPTQMAEIMIQVLILILENNYLQFNGKFYHQINGTAMGTPAAVTFANIFMYLLERTILQRHSVSVLYYKRYLDDIIAIVTGDPSSFIKGLCGMHPNIKLDIKISQSSADFLDLHIYKGHNFKSQQILDTSVHQKQLNAYLYVPYQSFHRQQTKGGFIVTELKRYIRNTSSFKDYLSIKRTFWSRLRARGYPPNFIEFYFSKVKFMDRKTLLQPKKSSESDTTSKVFFSTQYNPLTKNIPIKKLLKTYWSKDFNGKIMIGYSNSFNLHNILCSSKKSHGPLDVICLTS